MAPPDRGVGRLLQQPLFFRLFVLYLLFLLLLFLLATSATNRGRLLHRKETETLIKKNSMTSDRNRRPAVHHSNDHGGKLHEVIHEPQVIGRPNQVHSERVSGPQEATSFNYEEANLKRLWEQGNTTGLTPRPETCKKCFQNKFSFPINPDHVCMTSSPHDVIDVLMLILSVPSNSEFRQAIRETWASLSRNNTANIRYAFIMGSFLEAQQEEVVVREARMYRDIIQVGILDSYTNLTLKTISALDWGATYCLKAHFVYKGDEDVFVNPVRLVEVLRSERDQSDSTILGNCKQEGKPIRRIDNKWFVTLWEYPQDVYRGLCSGTGYAMKPALARRLVGVAASTPYFHLEDVYVGLCAHACGVTLRNMPGFVSYDEVPLLDARGRCRMHVFRKYVTKHPYLTPDLLRDIWRECFVQVKPTLN